VLYVVTLQARSGAGTICEEVARAAEARPWVQGSLFRVVD